MDWGFIIDFFYEAAYLLAVFMLFLVLSIGKGRQAIINVIFGLYLALLITLEFPYFGQLFDGFGSGSEAMVKLGFFALVTVGTTWLCARVMPDEFREYRFESLGKKILLAGSATILVMIFSFHVLPVTEFLTPGTPVQSLFAPASYFFFWLLVPLAVMFLV